MAEQFLTFTHDDELVTINADPDTSIWSPQVRHKIFPLPEDLAPLFIDTTYGNDVCPSYMTKNTHLVIWLHDEDTWADMGQIDGPPQFQIHYCRTSEAYGQSDPDKIQEYLCKTWDNTLVKVRSLLEQ
tara:strand:+ start:623 stop:1006 length:384 start_codon:yes stop_codon:yes gene_type:complete